MNNEIQNKTAIIVIGALAYTIGLAILWMSQI
jgi:hypothetical protein